MHIEVRSALIGTLIGIGSGAIMGALLMWLGTDLLPNLAVGYLLMIVSAISLAFALSVRSVLRSRRG